MKKKPTRKQIENKLDNVFSQFIRLSNTDKDGICVCYTCGRRYHRSEIQNGHFKTRGRHKTRREVFNCKPQCVGCNVFKHGNYQIYTLKMIEEHGKEWVESLLEDKSVHKFQTYELEEKLGYYTEEVNKIKEIKHL